jgi:hypothetical protein
MFKRFFLTKIIKMKNRFLFMTLQTFVTSKMLYHNKIDFNSFVTKSVKRVENKAIIGQEPIL